MELAGSSAGRQYSRRMTTFLIMIFSWLCFESVLPEQAEAKELVLDDIVVTSTKAGAVTSNAAVTVLTREDLEAKGARTLAEALRGVVGVDVASSGGAGQPTSIFIRGAKSEHTLVLIDGIEAADATSTTRYFDFSSLTIESIERVEIYRGARSTRFGADAVGGVINIISKKGRGEFATTVGFEAGSFQTKRINAAVSGADGNFNYSVGASRFTMDGFSAADGGDGDEPDSAARNSASTRLGWEFSPNGELDFTFRVVEAVTELDANGGTQGDDPNYDSNSRQILSGLSLRGDPIHGIESSVGLYFSDSLRKYDNWPDVSRAQNYHEVFQSENLKFETRHRGALATEIFDSSHVELGIQFRQEEGSTEQFLDGVATNVSRPRQRTWGESLIYDLEVSAFKFETGVRRDHVTPIDERVVSYSIAASYDFVASGTSLQANHGTGFKSPSLFQLYSNFGSSSLRSERAATWDLAIEQKIKGATLATLTYFKNDFENLIDFDVMNSKYGNISKAESEGVELQLVSNPVEHWTVKLSAKFLRTRDQTTGQELLRRPSRSYGAELGWNKERREVLISYRHVGSRPDIDPASFSRTELGEYGVLNALVKYTFQNKIVAHARFENLLDRLYQDVAGYRTSRRALYAGFTFDF